MQIKKSNLWIGLIVVVLLGVGYFVFSGQGSTVSTQNAQKLPSVSANVQVVNMWVENGQYKFDGSVKAGEPVKLVADMSRMPGCSKSFVMSDFGVRKTFTPSDNSVEFTPTQPGSYGVACSMNMYKGSLTVV